MIIIITGFLLTWKVRDNLENSGQGKSGNFFLNADYHEIKNCYDFHLNDVTYYFMIQVKHFAKC